MTAPESIGHPRGTLPPRGVSLYSTWLNVSEEMAEPPQSRFLATFGTVEEAALFADANGAGWYLYGHREGGYMGSIRARGDGSPEIREFRPAGGT